MIVALDGTPLSISSGGIRSYTQHLAAALAALPEDDEIWLISDQRVEYPAPVPEKVHVFSGTSGFLERKWWSIGARRRLRHLRADVFHGTDFSVPYLPACPSVLTLYDLSPWKEAAWHHDAHRVRRRTPPLLRFGIPTLVVTCTEAIRNEAISFFGLPPETIVSVPLGSNLSTTKPYEHPKPFILFAATLEPRKNLETVLSAWRQVRQTHDVDLLIAGRKRADGPRVDPEAGVHLLGEVSDHVLAALYSGAVACVYPSLYEGFGLPPLEAMSCGCPVIISKDRALREVSGGAAFEVDALDANAISAILGRLLADPEMRRVSRERGLLRAKSFSWESTARNMREVYARAIRRAAR